MTLLRMIALCCALCSTSACPGTLDDPERFSVQSGNQGINCDAPALLATKCGSSGCHASSSTSAIAPAAGLDLVSDDLMNRLDNASGSLASCSDWKLVVKGDPDNSLLVEILSSRPRCGTRMPLGQSSTLSDNDIQCIRSWISGENASGGETDGGGATDAGM